MKRIILFVYVFVMSAGLVSGQTSQPTPKVQNSVTKNALNQLSEKQRNAKDRKSVV